MGVANAEPVGRAGEEPEQLQARDDEPAAARHPRQGDGHLHVRPEHPAAGHGSRASRPPARPGRLRHGCQGALDRRELDQALPGAQVVRKGDFVAVVAPHEYDAIQAAAQLKVSYQDNPILPGNGNIVKQLRAQDAAGKTVNTATLTGNPDSALKGAATVLTQTYQYDYQMHGPIGPCCGVAAVSPSSALVLTNTQGTFRLRTFMANALNMPREADPHPVRRGLERFRTLRVGRCRRCGSDHLAAARRYAGAPPVHALGRPRLGQLRPAGAVGRQGRDRFERQDRRLRQRGVGDERDERRGDDDGDRRRRPARRTSAPRPATPDRPRTPSPTGGASASRCPC